MISCTRKIEFDSAHRVLNHESKCKYLHGHRYVLEVTFQAPELDNLGRVIDFGLIKDRIKKWVDDMLDHTTILYEKDHNLGSLIAQETGQKIYYMKSNPTAENIAIHLGNEILPFLFKDFTDLKITQVKLYETPNCSATYIKS